MTMSLPYQTESVPPEVETILTHVPLFHGARDLRITPLEGVVSLNNTNYRVRAGGADYLLRIGADTARYLGIRRDEESAAAYAAAQVSVGPKILYSDQAGCMVMPFILGRHWQSDDFHQPANIERLAAVLRRLHAVQGVGAEGFVYRRVERLLQSAVSLLPDLPLPLNAYMETMRRIEQTRLRDEHYSPGLVHGDLWANNFLDDAQNLWLIDWEFAGNGDGLYDLATCSLGGGYTEEEQRALLNAYGYTAPDALQHLQRMKWMARLFEGTWALVQQGLIQANLRPASSFDYRTYASKMFTALDVLPEEMF